MVDTAEALGQIEEDASANAARLDEMAQDPKEHKLLSKDDILDIDDIKREQVSVPEWGGDVLVQTLTGRERDAFERTMIIGKGKSRDVNLENFRAKLVAASLIDETGNKLFSQADVARLAMKSSAALQRVFAVAQKLSGFGDDEVEELTQELGKDQSDDSGSDLRLT